MLPNHGFVFFFRPSRHDTASNAVSDRGHAEMDGKDIVWKGRRAEL